MRGGGPRTGPPTVPEPVVLVGLPGVGKTTLALALAAAWSGAGRPAFVLHTDLLKVTARHLGLPWKGPTWADPARLEAATPLLDAHADKAARDGYALVVEGTLAVSWRRGRRVWLELDDDARQARCRGKHPAAAAATATLSDAPLRALRDAAAPCALTLDAAAPVATLLQQLQAHLQA